MEHSNHSLPSLIYHSPQVEHSLSPLLDYLWIKSVSEIDGAWWMLSGSTISCDLGEYTVIIDDINFMVASENSLVVWTTVWPDFTFGKWRFWWFRLRHLLGLCTGAPHCRTSTMSYSRTLFLLIVEKQICIEIECPYHQSTKRHWWMIYRIPSPQYQSPFSDNSLMLFYYVLSI